jgi:hypothetical protein
MTKADTPPKLKGEYLTTLRGIIQTASATVNKSDEFASAKDDNEDTIQDDNNANTENKDDDDDDVNAFLGIFGSLKE